MFVVVSVAWLVGCSSADTEMTTAGDVVGGSSSSSTSQKSATIAEVMDSTSTVAVQATTIPDGRAVVVPAGPYVDGQEVTLLASSSDRIDLHNSSPRLCARVNGNDESCDPTWVRPRPVSDAPDGTQGVAIEMARTHFGPTGESDCAEPDVQCRLIWRTETGRLLSSDILRFTGEVEPASVSLEASIGDQPGVVAVRAVGLDNEMSVDDVFSTPQMQTIEDDVRSTAQFDPSRLQLTWHVGGLCGFGPGDPPLGSEDLESPSSWWAPATLDPAADPSMVRSFFGASCDFLDADRPHELGAGGTLDLATSRNIYGFGGWIDCALAPCWVELVASWSYPMPDGSTLGSDLVVDRVLLDVPETWPTQRPTITVVEPGPYCPGQQVTVEVHDHPVTRDGLGIGWCPGGDDYCSYHFSTYTEGVHRVTWQIPPGSTECGSNRCYFEIESPGEGLAPPAIVVVPLLAD